MEVRKNFKKVNMSNNLVSKSCIYFLLSIINPIIIFCISTTGLKGMDCEYSTCFEWRNDAEYKTYYVPVTMMWVEIPSEYGVHEKMQVPEDYRLSSLNAPIIIFSMLIGLIQLFIIVAKDDEGDFK